MLAALMIAFGLAACSSASGDADPGEVPEAGDEVTADEDGNADVPDSEDPDASEVTADEGGNADVLDSEESDGDEDPADDVDYEDDAGLELETHEYPDDPEPADGIVATLCNLNQTYFTSLRAESDDGTPIVDDGLRLSVLSVDDNLSLWDSIRPHYPEAENAIDTARLIRNSWDAALLHGENGDAEAAVEAMTDAEEQIQNLPDEGGGSDVNCG